MAKAFLLFKDVPAPLSLTIVAMWFDIIDFGTTNKTNQASLHVTPGI